MNSQKIFEKIISLSGVTQEVAEFIVLLFAKKTPLIWVAPSLGIARDLSEVLAAENSMSVHFANFMQREAGIFSINPAEVQIFPFCQDFNDFLIGAIWNFYPDSERTQKYDNILKKYKYIIVFNENSMLSKLIEVKISDNGKIFFNYIFHRSDSLAKTGILPSNKDHWLPQWKNIKTQVEAPDSINITVPDPSFRLDNFLENFIPTDLKKIFEDELIKEIIFFESGDVYTQNKESDLVRSGGINRDDFKDLLSSLFQVLGKRKSDTSMIRIENDSLFSATAFHSNDHDCWVLFNRKKKTK